MDDFERCVANVLSTGHGFLIMGRSSLLTDDDESKRKHFLDSNRTYLLLRDVGGSELVTWAVEINGVSGLKSPLKEYRRTCELLFGFMSLTTQLLPSIDSVLHSDQWPPTDEKESSAVIVKKRQPDCELESTEEDEDDDNEKKTKADVHISKPKKSRIEYRFAVDRNSVDNFMALYQEFIERVAPNTDSHAVLRWGMTEAMSEKSQNPFRYVPLLPYGITPNEWLYSKVKGKSIADMIQAMLHHETHLVGDVLYRNTEEGYIVSKSNSTPWPMVHLTDMERERPETERPNVFMLALFFHLYAGGKISGLKVTDIHHLQICLSDAVQSALTRETNQIDALNRYKQTLVEITNGRTDFKVIDCFNTVSDMAACSIVCPDTLKYDVRTAYTHPCTGRSIKLAERKAPDGSSRVVARWTDIVVNAPKADFLQSSNIRKALARSSEEQTNRQVDVAAIKALGTESGVSLAEAILTFAEVPTDVRILLSAAPPGPSHMGRFLERR